MRWRRKRSIGGDRKSERKRRKTERAHLHNGNTWAGTEAGAVNSIHVPHMDDRSNYLNPLPAPLRISIRQYEPKHFIEIIQYFEH